jgi:hypothetical protein
MSASRSRSSIALSIRSCLCTLVDRPPIDEHVRVDLALGALFVCDEALEQLVVTGHRLPLIVAVHLPAHLTEGTLAAGLAVLDLVDVAVVALALATHETELALIAALHLLAKVDAIIGELETDERRLLHLCVTWSCVLSILRRNF